MKHYNGSVIKKVKGGWKEVPYYPTGTDFAVIEKEHQKEKIRAEIRKLSTLHYELKGKGYTLVMRDNEITLNDVAENIYKMFNSKFSD